jgi:hypothetical protein
VLPAAIIVLTVYVWFVSIGTWTEWPQRYSYSHHDKLASAFRRGQLFLEQAPDPRLLALADPYDPLNRADIPIIIDGSLHNGKYYLYFGPVPALLLVVVKSIIPGVIGDQYVTFAFVCATFLMEVLLLTRIRRCFFPTVSASMLGACVLFVGLATPLGWVVENAAAVHDGAIAAGQLFFLAGLYAAFGALEATPASKGRAFLAGLLWSASIGSRITQCIPIALSALILLIAVVRKSSRSPGRETWIPFGLAFAAPLAFAAIALGWYNWARFGSVLETGFSYQLAWLHMQGHWEDVFSIKYVPQNLHNYLLMPPKIRYNFPYVWPRHGYRSSLFPGIDLPTLYFAEEITGLLFAIPFLVLALAPFHRVGIPHMGEGAEETKRALFRWLSASLGSAFLAGFALLLVFFWATERYYLDFVPPGVVLSVMGFWGLLAWTRTRWLLHAATILAGLGLMAVSVLVSNLTAIGYNAQGFRSLNPVLWMQLNNVFRP